MATPADPQPLTTLIPRLRRAIDGPTDAGLAAIAFTDSDVEAAAADALADVILYSAGQFRHQLVVLGRDSTYEAPDSWAVTPPLEPQEETLIVAQAAINAYFHYFRGLKTSETITNEGQSWDYDLSANLIRDQHRQLVAARDAALAALERQQFVATAWVSYIEARDYATARLIEPWTTFTGLPLLPQAGPSGLEAVENFGP